MTTSTLEISSKASLKNESILKNPFLIFFPFLIFYTIWVLNFYSKTLWGDEVRHIIFAKNLLQGFYSPPPPQVMFDMGPGYPLFLAPFIGFHIPLIFAYLMNAVFTYLTAVFLFKSLKEFVSFKIALTLSLFMACYYNQMEFIGLLYSESITLFLISVILLVLIKAFKNKENQINTKYVWLSGVLFGYLALTKIIFGYVLMILLSSAIILWLCNRKHINYRKNVIIFLIALFTTSPYLIYTYHLTGRLFYWGTSGGISIYWMSTPFEGEYGNWGYNPKYNFKILPDYTKDGGTGISKLRNRDNFIPGGEDSIIEHHKQDFADIQKYDGVDEDDEYKRLAVKNIEAHPAKFLQNCISNLGRILFNYPYSYTIQKPGTLLRLPMNGIIIVLLLFSLIPTFINWQKLIFPLQILIFVVLLYLGGTLLACSETRIFTPIVPILLFWIGYIMSKSVKIKLKFKDNNSEG